MFARTVLLTALSLALAAPRLAGQPGTAIVVTRTQSALELAPYAGYMFPADLKSGPLGTRATIAGGPVYGAQAMLPLLPGAALMANVAHARSELNVRAPLVGGWSFGNNQAWFVDAGIQIGATGGGGGGRPFQPFVQVGGGAVRRTLSAVGLSATATDFAWHAGVGVDAELAPNLALRAVARDYVAPFDFDEAIFVDLEQETMHNIAVSVGVRLSL